MAFSYGEAVQVRGLSAQFISNKGSSLNGLYRIKLSTYEVQYLGNITDIHVDVYNGNTRLSRKTVEYSAWKLVSSTYFGYDSSSDGNQRSVYANEYTIDVSFTASELQTMFRLFPNAGTLSLSLQTTTSYWNSTFGTKTIEKNITAGGAINTPPPVGQTGWCKLKPNNASAGGSKTFQFYLKGKSKVNVEFTKSLVNTTNLYGATIYKLKLTVDSKVYQVSVNDKSAVTFDSNILNTAGKIKCTVAVIDSRGNEFTLITQNITVYDYFAPTLSAISAYRCDSKGIQANTGTYIYVKAKEAHASVGGNNSASLKLRYKPTAGVFTQYVNLKNNTAQIVGDGKILLTTAYMVEITATDLAGFSATFNTFVPTETVILSVKDGGNAIAVGMYANNEPDFTFNIAFNTFIHGNLTIGNTTLTELQLQRLLSLI